MISVHSLPAVLALIIKLIVLYLSRQSPIKDFKTRVFELALVTAIVQSVVEVIGLNVTPRTDNPRYHDIFGFSYYVTIIATITVLSHLAIAITFGARRLSNTLAGFIYGYALLVIGLLLFTSMVVTRFDVLQGYSVTRVPGPAMWLVELLVLVTTSAMIVLPFIGLRASRPAVSRNQCKLWIAGAVPANILLLSVVILLHFKIRLFNYSLTAPLFVLFTLISASYAVHTRRPIELDFYFPWSRTRRRKKALYRRLDQLTKELSSLKSPKHVLERLAKTLQCPMCLIYADGQPALQAGHTATLTTFPVKELAHVEHMLVTNEIADVENSQRALLEKHRVGAIVPFYPNCRAACWLLLEGKFSDNIYTSADFSAAASLFDRLAIVLLDRILDSQPAARLEDPVGEYQTSLASGTTDVALALPHSLDDYVADFEKQLIEKVLNACEGHKSNAARLLGLRPSTLHYKLERYGLVVPLYRRRAPKGRKKK